jgi:hypothetical protein
MSSKLIDIVVIDFKSCPSFFFLLRLPSFTAAWVAAMGLGGVFITGEQSP